MAQIFDKNMTQNFDDNMAQKFRWLLSLKISNFDLCFCWKIQVSIHVVVKKFKFRSGVVVEIPKIDPCWRQSFDKELSTPTSSADFKTSGTIVLSYKSFVHLPQNQWKGLFILTIVEDSSTDLQRWLHVGNYIDNRTYSSTSSCLDSISKQAKKSTSDNISIHQCSKFNSFCSISQYFSVFLC